MFDGNEGKKKKEIKTPCIIDLFILSAILFIFTLSIYFNPFFYIKHTYTV